jgi:hypothetical protein
MSQENEDGDSPLDSKYYFDLGNALDEVKTEFQIGDAADKVTSSAKLLGKTIFNVGLFAGKLGWETLKSLPEAAEKAGKK